MTKISIVNENDEVIGAEYRKIATANGLRHRIVRIFLVRSDGKILLQQRSLDRDDNPGKWDQSVGGHVDEGEDYETAAVREVKEELGVDVLNSMRIGKFYIERDSPNGVLRRFQTVFLCDWNGEVFPNAEEVAQVKWFAPDEIRTW